MLKNSEVRRGFKVGCWRISRFRREVKVSRWATRIGWGSGSSEWDGSQPVFEGGFCRVRVVGVRDARSCDQAEPRLNWSGKVAK